MIRRHFCTFLWWLARKSSRLALRLEAPRGVGWTGVLDARIFNARAGEAVTILRDSLTVIRGDSRG